MARSPGGLPLGSLQSILATRHVVGSLESARRVSLTSQQREHVGFYSGPFPSENWHLSRLGRLEHPRALVLVGAVGVRGGWVSIALITLGLVGGEQAEDLGDCLVSFLFVVKQVVGGGVRVAGALGVLDVLHALGLDHVESHALHASVDAQFVGDAKISGGARENNGRVCKFGASRNCVAVGGRGRCRAGGRAILFPGEGSRVLIVLRARVILVHPGEVVGRDEALSTWEGGLRGQLRGGNGGSVLRHQ